MKKKLAIIGIVTLLICINFSGCTETKSTETKAFIENLQPINDNLGTALGNINTHFFNYDLQYKWTILMNYLTFTESMIKDIQEYEEDVDIEITNIENIINDYQQSKEEADLNQLTVAETNVMSEIEASILDYETNKNTLVSSLNAMETYRNFLNFTRLKLIMLENYENTLNLMNSQVENGETEDALINLEQLIEIVKDLKVNERQRANLSVQNYSEEMLGIWDIYIDAWDLYNEYLELILDGRYTQADSKYTEYSEKYNEALELESGENISEGNNEIDQWYQNNVAVSFDLFENYS